MARNYDPHLGQVLKQQRVQLSLTLHELAVKSKISKSHLGRIERGERFPSAHVLRRIAGPLGFEEQELFVLARFLGQGLPKMADDDTRNSSRRLDPYVARVLAGEPVEVQRAAVVIITILKSLAKNLRRR
jgi:transcriptional regulator with XRE-family HTH domain